MPQADMTMPTKTTSKPLKSIWILIPSYQPEPVLAELIDGIYHAGIENIILVDDGSDEKDIFTAIKQKHPQLNFISYEQNKGKGGALKEGYAVYVDKAEDDSLIVAMDADGQHTIEDALKLAQAHQDNQYTLGVRNFDENIPFRSKFGNKCTRIVSRLTKGIDLTDTQTGLRAVSKPLANAFLDIPINGYAFEFECLIMAKNMGYQFGEMPIETIYIDDNSSSHFNPVLDSIKIYWGFIKYLFVAVASLAIDFLLFYIFLTAISAFFNTEEEKNIFVATILARIISSTFNFLANKYITFVKEDRSTLFKEAILYALLVIVVGSISGGVVTYIESLQIMPVMLAKLLVDGGLYILNYFILKRFIFKV